jgi:hypothetical protein
LPPSSAGALFDPAEFHWKPFKNYFDLDKLSADLPCRFISNENFGLLFDDWRQHLSIRILYYGHGSNTTVPGQVRSYYKMLFGDRAVTTEEYLPDSFQLPLDRARLLFGGRGETVLAMSSMFWLYDFGRRVEYPLKKYYDYLSQPADFMYRKIVTALWPVMRIATQSMAIQAVKKNMRNGRQFVALHIRRGDYWKKCQTDFGPDSPYADSRMLRRCYATDESIIQLLRSRFPVDRALMIYICTNGRRGHAAVPPSHRKSDYDFTAFSSSLPPGWTVLMWEDLHAKINDPNEIALTEQMIAVGADYFIGNLWSSFSRHIQEWRALRNRSSDWI